MVAAQVSTVTQDITVHAVKTGMLARPATVRAMADLVDQRLIANLVVDPVLVSSTGHPLMEAGGVEAYRDLLLPRALVATPNLREAAVLLGVDVREFDSIAAMKEAGRAIQSLGASWVVIKGGHYLEGGATADQAPDLVVGPDTELLLEAIRVETANDHGTGCSLAAAITANIALGNDVAASIATAKDFVARALNGARHWHLGDGHGPIDHLGFEQG